MFKAEEKLKMKPPFYDKGMTNGFRISFIEEGTHMKFLGLILILFQLVLVGCSKNKKMVNNQKGQVTKLSEEDLFSDKDLPPGSENRTFSEQQDIVEESHKQVEIDEGTSSGWTPGAGNTYVVQKNDTLMMISYKIYGDYRKWKTLKDKKGRSIASNNLLRNGMTLVYNPALIRDKVDPVGNPYLIKLGDTLGKISNGVYGSKKFWKSLWENNKLMILNPNLIFSGFTLYYLNKEDIK
jgi:nucleoid-associated protein YgaU